VNEHLKPAENVVSICHVNGVCNQFNMYIK